MSHPDLASAVWTIDHIFRVIVYASGNFLGVRFAGTAGRRVNLARPIRIVISRPASDVRRRQLARFELTAPVDVHYHKQPPFP
jgi:hypothetical protein